MGAIVVLCGVSALLIGGLFAVVPMDKAEEKVEGMLWFLVGGGLTLGTGIAIWRGSYR